MLTERHTRPAAPLETTRRRPLAGLLGRALCAALGVLMLTALAVASAYGPAYVWNLPAWAPLPVVPASNPMSEAKVNLGRWLFYDVRLSADRRTSCAACHQQTRAFTDARKVAIGATGERHPRNTMSLANTAYAPTLTWANPLLTELEPQALIPMFGEHPVEMGLAGREEQIARLMRRDPRYARLFKEAFPQDADPYTIGNLVKAIASFQRTLNSFDSPYDRYRYGGDSNAISAAAKRGEALFFSERLECFHCHGGINLTDSVRHQRLAEAEIAFHNTGLYNVDGKGAYPSVNTGLYEHSGKPEDMGRFKAPTLRNITVTAPYMHDGSIATLDSVIDHYAQGGRAANNPHKSEFVRGFSLTPAEKRDLLAFLAALTDRAFLTNPKHADPFNPPSSGVKP